MPKDDWAKAKRKDAAKKAVADKPNKRKRHGRHGRRHAISKQRTNACNPNTKLWFGKYKDQAIKDIPRSYLSWLAQQSSQSWRIELVQTYLLNYLSLQSPL